MLCHLMFEFPWQMLLILVLQALYQVEFSNHTLNESGW